MGFIKIEFNDCGRGTYYSELQVRELFEYKGEIFIKINNSGSSFDLKEMNIKFFREGEIVRKLKATLLIELDT